MPYAVITRVMDPTSNWGEILVHRDGGSEGFPRDSLASQMNILEEEGFELLKPLPSAEAGFPFYHVIRI